MQFDKGHSQRHSAGFGVMGLKWGLALLTLVILTGVCAVTAHAAVPYISRIDVKDMGDMVQITAYSSSAVKVHTGRLGDRYIVVDMQGHLAMREQKRVTFNAAGIRAVRSARFMSTPPTARIAVGTTTRLEYSVKPDLAHNSTVVLVRKHGTVAAKQGAVSPKQSLKAPAVRGTYTAMKPVPGGSERPLGDGTTPVAVRSQRLVSLDFVGSDIHDVLKALALQGGVNIVTSPDVKGDVTVSLTKVSVDEALKLITNISGFKYQFVDGSYVVGTAANIKNMAASASGTEETATEVVIINYADPIMIMKMIEGQYPDVNISSNVGKEAKLPAVLVLTGSRSSIDAAKLLAEGIDESISASAQDLTTEVYEVKYADITELAVLVAAAVPGLRVSVGPGQGFNLKRPEPIAMGKNAAPTTTSDLKEKTPAKMLLIQGSAAGVEKAKALLAKLDTSIPQIMIEAKIVDISDSGSKDLGIKWGDELFGLSSTTFIETAVGASQAISFGRYDRSPLNIDANIKAMVQSGNGKILANPNVMALDGKPASIFIGDEINYVSAVMQASSGTASIVTDVAKVGIQLNTISRISDDGFITMNLHPEVSVITKWVKTGDLELPQISRRYVDSTIRIKDGETIVIGGLIRDEDIKSMTGVPFLSNLPIIGQLFKQTSTKKTHSEVMMFITPKLVK